jgi:hypothetical protein
VTSDERTAVVKVADEVIALVRATPVGGGRGDTGGLIMVGAYAHGFRRLRAIRLLAGVGAGAEAMILARSLLSMLARAAYVDAPSDNEERRRRFLRYQANDLHEAIRARDRLEAAGFDVEYEEGELEEALAEIGDVGGFPNDTALMRDHVAGLAPFHARIYGPSSDHVHFSQQAAIAGLYGAEEFDLDSRDPALADEALLLALITYGRLLELSEKTVGHGLTQRVADLVRGLFGQGEGSDSA